MRKQLVENYIRKIVKEELSKQVLNESMNLTLKNVSDDGLKMLRRALQIYVLHNYGRKDGFKTYNDLDNVYKQIPIVKEEFSKLNEYNILSGKLKDLKAIKSYLESEYSMNSPINIKSFDKDSNGLYVLNLTIDGKSYRDWFVKKGGYYYHVD